MRCALSTLAVLSAASPVRAETTDLYMDQKTKQIFAEPGPGRVKFGQAVVTKDANVGAPDKATINISCACCRAGAITRRRELGR
jgi:hypothetical protein